MIDAQKLLGMMLGTGMGGHNARGNDLMGTLAGAFGGQGGGAGGDLLSGLQRQLGGAQATSGQSSRAGAGALGGLGGSAGVAMLGALAFKAFQQYAQRPSAPGASAGGDVATAQDAGGALDDSEAMLLTRAMIAAASADGKIDADEQQRILGRLGEAGITGEEQRFVLGEMRNPPALDSLLREVKDPQAAERFYAVSALAITADTPAERSYLRYLADRLGIEGERESSLLHDLGVGQQRV
jgi:uncharacterized membrane protein YebE (DUF533 family)